MNFFDYIDFDDFCKKNNFTRDQGLEFLDKELVKRKEGLKCRPVVDSS